MAITLIPRKMRAVGALHGGPPLVAHFDLTATARAAGDIMMFDQSAGQAEVADVDSTTWLVNTNLDQLL